MDELLIKMMELITADDANDTIITLDRIIILTAFSPFIIVLIIGTVEFIVDLFIHCIINPIRRLVVGLLKSDYRIEHKAIKCDYETGDISVVSLSKSDYKPD